MQKNEIIQKIINKEWFQFTNTKNISQRAICQDQKGNFIASRTAYWNMYDIDILNSYLSDINSAISKNQNLITYKYAYMMKYTDKANYDSIKDMLPKIDEKKEKLIDTILLMYMSWEAEIVEKYPELDNKNRKLYSSSDTINSTSVETYMRGELSTYSYNTLELIAKYFLVNISNKVNLVYEYMTNLNNYESTSGKKAFSCNCVKNIDNLNLANAELIAKYAKDKAISMNLPVVITVVDKHANVLLFCKMDKALIASSSLSPAKAKTSISFRTDTHTLSQGVLKYLNQFEAENTSYCFLGGGVPILVKNEIIGAIGISGGTVEQDIEIANEAVTAFLKFIF